MQSNKPPEPQQVSFAHMFAEFTMLGARGVADVKPCDDAESQALASAVRRVNRHWRPGLKVRLPGRTPAPRRPVVAITKPREGRSSRRQRSSSRGDPDPPEPSASPFAAAHRALLSLTAGELDALADIATRRAGMLRASRWAA